MNLSNYIETRQRALQTSPRKALIMAHVVCGYPSFEENWQELKIMEEFGVDLVELQFPFSEPSADGPLFVKANQCAIDSGVSVADCFAFMHKASNEFSFQLIMMGYYNTVFKMGHAAFLQSLQQAGGSAFILPDLPVEESRELHQIAQQMDLAPIMLMTPTNSTARLEQIAKAAQGFVYTVARKGVTGQNTDMNKDVSEFIRRCRTVTKLPLAVGFGVSKKPDVDFIAEHADIAVIGTAALRAWQADKETGLRSFFQQLLE